MTAVEAGLLHLESSRPNLKHYAGLEEYMIPRLFMRQVALRDAAIGGARISSQTESRCHGTPDLISHGGLCRG